MRAISSLKSKRENPLIRFNFAARALAIALATTLASSAAARADVTLGLGGGPAIGTYGDIDGATTTGGRPVPVVDLDANFGSLELSTESLVYQRTRYYGNPFAPSMAALSSFDATLRAYEPGHRLAFGVGYAGVLATTFRTFPTGTLATQASGVRLELHERVPLTTRATLELTFGGEPDLHGTTRASLGVAGAPPVVDAIAGQQLEASAIDVVRANRTLSFAYGLRYTNTDLRFAKSTALVEHDARLVPFVQLRLQR